MINAFFMGWTDPWSKIWYPFKKLTWENDKYHVVYLQGVSDAFDVSPGLRSIFNYGLHFVDGIETSDKITGEFSKLVHPIDGYVNPVQLKRLSLPEEERLSPFEYTARSNFKNINHHDVFPEITPDRNDVYHFYFGSSDIREIEMDEKKIKDCIAWLKIGDSLSVADNDLYHDRMPLSKIPGYIADLYRQNSEAITVSVAKVNCDGYKYDNLIFHVKVNGKIIIPFSDSRYQPLLSLPQAPPNIWMKHYQS